VALSSGGNVFEQLGAGFTLIALDGGGPEPAAAFRAAAAHLGIPLHVIADTPDGPRAAYQQRFVLVRPDQYVAWTGNDPPADATAVLRRAVGGPATSG
jgi:4-hydroxyisophthalate hydroxylase